MGEKEISEALKRCSFCEKPEENVRLIINHQTKPIRICNECVIGCMELIVRNCIQAKKRAAGMEEEIFKLVVENQTVLGDKGIKLLEKIKGEKIE